MAPTARVSSSQKSSVGILRISGEVTDHAESAILGEFQALQTSGSKKFLLVFDPATFINSSGLRVLLALIFQAQAAKRPVRMTGLSSHMMHVFELVGLDQYAKILPTEEAALKGWK